MTAQKGAARREGSEESPADVLPELYQQLRTQMRLVLYRYRIPADHGEDLIQAVFVLAITTWSEIRQPAAWLLGALTNRCILYWRVRRLEESRLEALDGALLPAIEPAQEKHTQLVDLDSAWRQLSAAQRRLLVLRYKMGLGPLEAAKAMGLAHGSLRKTTNRTLRRLRELLGAPPPARPRSRPRSKVTAPWKGLPAPAAWTRAIDAYLAAANLRPTTRTLYRCHLMGAGVVLGQKALAQLAESDLAGYRVAVLQDGRNAGSQLASLVAVRSCLFWSFGQGLHSVEAKRIRIALRGWCSKKGGK